MVDRKKKVVKDGDRKPYGEARGSDRDRKPYGEARGTDRDRKPYGETRGSDRDRKPYGEARGTDRDRKPYGDTRGSDRDRKPYGETRGTDRDRKPYGETRGFDRDRKPYDDTRGFEREETVDEQDRLEGRNSVLEALKANRPINKIVVSRGDKEGSIKQLIALAREKGIIIQETDRVNLDKVSLTHAHQGVIAYVAFKDYVEVDDILEIAASKGEHPFIILLDGITDLQNLGSIIRTADAVGAHGVVIPKRRAAGLNSIVSKASAGALEYVPVARVTNIVQTIEYLKKKNLWIIGTDQSGQSPFYEADLKGPIALVVGSEGEGMGKLVTEKCDVVVNIPMKGKIASLNASVAGAVVMYEISRQRGR